LEGVPAEGRASASFQKALNTFAHIVGARLVWLHRFGAAPALAPLFDENVDLSSLRPSHERMCRMWRAWLRDATDEGIAGRFSYRSYDGDRFTSTYEEILTQLFGHSWYHRGQIASLVKQCGGTPAITDYVFFTRVPAGDGG
jgi:uncharacterized damage-inducible protein DinB